MQDVLLIVNRGINIDYFDMKLRGFGDLFRTEESPSIYEMYKEKGWSYQTVELLPMFRLFNNDQMQGGRI